MTTMPADRSATTRSLLRAAAGMYGAERLAYDLDVEPRSLHRWIDGTRSVPTKVPGQVRQLLIARRQSIVVLIQQLRIVEGLTDEGR